MNSVGVGSLVKILSKNSEMALPKKTSYKVLAAVAVSLIMIPMSLHRMILSLVLWLKRTRAKMLT